VPDRRDISELGFDEEVLLEKYEGEYKEGDKPIEVLRIKDGKVIERILNPPPMDSSLAVNTQTLGVDNASN
jgi:hypothetical protein